MEKIYVYVVNFIFLRIVTPNVKIYKELDSYFSKYVKNYFFMSKFKNGSWDGKTKLFKKGLLPIGLFKDFKKFCEIGGYKFKIIKNSSYELVEKVVNEIKNIEDEKIHQFIEMLKLPYVIKDYQVKSVIESIKKRKLLNILPTSSGKSLIIYVIVRFLHDILKIKPILIIVPRVQLVKQLYDNFKEYGWKELDEYVGKIYANFTNDKIKEYEKKDIIISTWQSLQRKRPDYFIKFKGVMIDEAHSLKSLNVLSKILSYCVNAIYTLGFSGTIDVDEKYSDYYTLKGYLGEIKEFVDYERLLKEKAIVDFNIKILYLKYPKDEIFNFFNYINENEKTPYMSEVEYLMKNKYKNDFIINDLIKDIDNNVIVLFTRIEQGQDLLKKAKKYLKNKRIYYIDGGVNVDIRSEIVSHLETFDNCVLFASYGTFSEGINIHNIYNIIFASAYKSKIKTLQSIGRGLRLHKNKILNVYDIVDDLSFNEYSNYSIKHIEERIKIYDKYKFKYDIEKIKLS